MPSLQKVFHSGKRKYATSFLTFALLFYLTKYNSYKSLRPRSVTRGNNLHYSLANVNFIQMKQSSLHRELQEQDVLAHVGLKNQTNLSNGRSNGPLEKKSLHLWKAILDERYGNDKAIVILGMINRQNRVFLSTEIELHRLSCELRNIYGEVMGRMPAATAADLFTFTGFIIACIVPQSLHMSSHMKYFVSLEHQFLPTTNYLILDRQTQPKTGVSDGKIGICMHPLISLPHSTSTTFGRIVEWIEYYKMLNISRIHIPVIALPQANQIPSETLGLLQYYEKDGFVEMGTEAPFQNQSEINWGTINYIKPLVLTHCYLKNAMQYEYILLLEADEALVYDFRKYKNLEKMFSAGFNRFAPEVHVATMRFPEVHILTGCDNMMSTEAKQKLIQVHPNASKLGTLTEYAKLKLPNLWNDLHFLKYNKGKQGEWTRGSHMGKPVVKTSECLAVYPHDCHYSLFDVQYWKYPSTQYNLSLTSLFSPGKMFALTYHYRNVITHKNGKLNVEGESVTKENIDITCSEHERNSQNLDEIISNMGRELTDRIAKSFQKFIET